MTFEYRRTHGLNASVVRIFNTYGPHMAIDDGRVVPAFIGAALAGEPLPVFGDGRQTRSLCYVSDLVEALLLVAFDGNANGRVFNLGNPHEVTMLELARAVSEAAGSETGVVFSEAAADDPSRRRPDITRMQERYGWQPIVGLADGLRQTVDYFSEQASDRVAVASEAA